MVDQVRRRLAALENDTLDLFARTRARSRHLVSGLRPEDLVVQSMEGASPTKWHLAHTSWFFEQFFLREHLPGYTSPDDRFAFLFNSYYVQAGPRHARSKRGLITRPGMSANRLTSRSIKAASLMFLASKVWRTSS